MEQLPVVLYLLVLILLSALGLHRARLVYLCWRHRRRLAGRRPPLGEPLPRVTVQLPLYNEAGVVQRLLDAVCRLDYPRDRLEIQVLDDSTDETRRLARCAVEAARARGVEAVYLHREQRVGYKAGALAAGLRVARGELVAIFDADFVPPPHFLRAVVGHFADPAVGMVQTRWAHLNRGANLLTRVQALMLDAHHLVENRARAAAGLLFNFSGTGGIWRREAIESAGGWQHDTLTEDLDLSYRAQLLGWRFIYRPDVVTPAELPEQLSTLRTQQHRWAKGTMQTARKLLGCVLRAPLPLGHRLEALLHLTPHLAYPLLVLLVLLLPVVLAMTSAAGSQTWWVVDLPLVLGTTGSLGLFYGVTERSQGRSWLGGLLKLPVVIALGAGLSAQLTLAVNEAFGRSCGEFVRTPKRGDSSAPRRRGRFPLLELGLALVSGAGALLALLGGHPLAAPFAALFCCGHLSVALLDMRERAAAERRARTVDPLHAKGTASS